MKQISVLIEGPSDEGVVKSILRHCGFESAIVIRRGGKGYIQANIDKYNRAAQSGPWFVLVDLDNLNLCPVAVRKDWLPAIHPQLVFNIAVAEVESWILADRERVADFLGVSVAKVPRNPDEIPNPKEFLINLAKASRRRDIREGLVPRKGSGAPVGETYVSQVREFGATAWRPAVAADQSPSLARCIARLERLA